MTDSGRTLSPGVLTDVHTPMHTGVMTPHLLLITTAQGATVAVRFPSADAARDWEDEHEMDLGTVVGLIPLVTKAEALRG